MKADGINAVVVKVSDGQTVLDPPASVNIKDTERQRSIICSQKKGVKSA
ncbi:hypothetical protein [Weizmannia acidilactici]